MEMQERRRRSTLSEQLSAAAVEVSSSAAKFNTSSPSPNLRDLLKVRQEEDLYPLGQHRHQQSCGRRTSSVSLGTFLACEKRELSAGLTAVTAAATTIGSRTLLDIIRNEESGVGGGAVYSGVVVEGGHGSHKISWRAFRERLRVRRAGASWQVAGGGADDPVYGVSAAELVISPPAAVSSPGIPVPERSHVVADAVPEHNRSSSVVTAGEATATERLPPMPTVIANPPNGAASTGGETEGSNRGPSPTTAVTEEGQQQPQQIRVSLMALLEQTDRQGGGWGGTGFAVSALLEAREQAEAEEGAPGGQGEKMYVKCCVCMVRNKGAAFIPCGHTFCRLCSRELWVSRGSCPLCNGFILEILDIF